MCPFNRIKDFIIIIILHFINLINNNSFISYIVSLVIMALHLISIINNNSLHLISVTYNNDNFTSYRAALIVIIALLNILQLVIIGLLNILISYNYSFTKYLIIINNNSFT